MGNISDPVVRKDHEPKISGREKYVGDFFTSCSGGEILSAKLVRTQKAHAEIISVAVPDLPEGYSYIDGRDAPRNVSFYPLNDTEAVLTKEEAEKSQEQYASFCRQGFGICRAADWYDRRSGQKHSPGACFEMPD